MNVSNLYYSLNLFYLHKFKGTNHQLTASVFYADKTGDDTEVLDEYKTDNTWSIENINPEKQRSFEGEEELELRVKTDYVKQFNEKTKLEAGLQSRIDNGTANYMLENYDVDNGVWIENTKLHNSMEFKRNIHAAYTTFTHNLADFDFMLGIRGEVTDRNIRSIVMDTAYPVERFDFFPSFHVSRKLPANQQVQASYSRRIHRPNEWYLDPFPNFSDPQNIRVGNPALEPEYINSFELGYQNRIKKTFISVEAYYRKTLNKINRIRTLDNNNVMYHTFDNLSSDVAMGLELMTNIEIYKWWLLNISGNVFNYQIDGEILETGVNQAINTYSTRFNTTFILKTDTRIQLNGFYNAPSITAQGDRDAFFMMGAGVRQDFFKKRLSATFNVRDIFNTMKFSFTTEASNFYAYNEFTRKSPSFSISITYKLNNYKQDRSRDGNRDIDFDGGDDVI